MIFFVWNNCLSSRVPRLASLGNVHVLAAPVGSLAKLAHETKRLTDLQYAVRKKKSGLPTRSCARCIRRQILVNEGISSGASRVPCRPDALHKGLRCWISVY